MKTKPRCTITDCDNFALILFGDSWICGECMAAYDKATKKLNFSILESVLKNAN